MRITQNSTRSDGPRRLHDHEDYVYNDAATGTKNAGAVNRGSERVGGVVGVAVATVAVCGAASLAAWREWRDKTNDRLKSLHCECGRKHETHDVLKKINYLL